MSGTAFKENKGEVEPGLTGALYVHVPFCRGKCRYCNFFSVPYNDDLAKGFTSAAMLELDRYRPSLINPLESIFIGGGTPTALGTEPLEQLLSALEPLADSSTEFTIEANPEALEPATLKLIVEAGVNRLSMGVQSFLASELETLGRRHSSAQAVNAVLSARQVGIANINLDLIYGIPGQSVSTFRDSIAQALDLGIEHLSCYGLTFEQGTPLWHDLRAERVKAMSDELQRECYYTAILEAESAGRAQYEISNFAKPSMQCRHNLTYWQNRSYLGIGPSAASYLAGTRRTNKPDLLSYTSALSDGTAPPSTSEHLVGRAAMAETLMLGMRMIQGVDRVGFTSRFGQDPVDAFPQSMNRHKDLGTITITDHKVSLARNSLFVSDSILADILSEQ